MPIIYFTWTTFDKNRSMTPLSFSHHSTVHLSPFSKLSISTQLPNTGLLSNGTFLPDAVVIDTIFLVLNVAMIWIFSAKDSPVSEGNTSIHTLCSLLIDWTVICLVFSTHHSISEYVSDVSAITYSHSCYFLSFHFYWFLLVDQIMFEVGVVGGQ